MVKFNIAISGERGTEWKAVNGYIYPAGAPVFGIHCHKRGEWIVTHLETGRRASLHMCGSRGSAQLLVDALLTNPPLPWSPWPKTRSEQYQLYRFACKCWNRCFPTDAVEPAPERKPRAPKAVSQPSISKGDRLRMVDGYEATALGAPKGIIVPIEIDGPYRELGTCYLNAIASVNGAPFQPTAAQLERLEVVRKAGF